MGELQELNARDGRAIAHTSVREAAGRAAAFVDGVLLVAVVAFWLVAGLLASIVATIAIILDPLIRRFARGGSAATWRSVRS